MPSSGRGSSSDIWTDEEAACSSWADDVDDGREVPECAARCTGSTGRQHWQAALAARLHTAVPRPAPAHARTPRFELRYKQCVSTADNYLGMSGKDPSSSCCEELLVLVQLPKAASAAGGAARAQLPAPRPTGMLQGCSHCCCLLMRMHAEMELDVTTQRLCLSSAA